MHQLYISNILATAKGTLVRKMGFLRVFAEMKLKAKTAFMHIRTESIDLPAIMAFLRTNMYWKFTDRVRQVKATVSYKAKRLVSAGLHVLKATVKKKMGFSALQIKQTRRLQAALNQKRGETHTVDAMPLSFVHEDTMIRAGVTSPFSVYHTMYVTVYMQSMDGALARVIFSMSQGAKHRSAVHAAMRDVTFLRLLQWFLHRIDVSNEGYSQEIVYDLGTVPPVGPLPPTGDESWTGGYVDYPFKGMGFASSAQSDGYASPEAEDWIKNAKMFWDKETGIFDGKDVTP
jgi:hypothetical protein